MRAASLSIMASEEEQRKRKNKFDSLELEVLVAEANKHISDLQQRNLNITKRNLIWSDICAKVNAVGKTKRTVDEVKRRWQDLRRRTKEKLSFNKSSANKTGGGPAEEIPLTPAEQQVQLSFCEEQISGIEGYDTLEFTAEAGKRTVKAHQCWPHVKCIFARSQVNVQHVTMFN